jgi:succinyl-CoA synthetase beta subunit
MKKIKIPEDLGIVMATKEEAYWTAIKGNIEIEIRRMGESLEHQKKIVEDVEKQIKFNKAILEMAEDKIEMEKD